MVYGSTAQARWAHMNNQSNTGCTGYTGYIGDIGYIGYNDSTIPHVSIENIRLRSKREFGEYLLGKKLMGGALDT